MSMSDGYADGVLYQQRRSGGTGLLIRINYHVGGQRMPSDKQDILEMLARMLGQCIADKLKEEL